MQIRQLAILFYVTILAFSALYTPQPLQPVLQAVFNVSGSDASLLITLTLIPLGIAPIFYGLWLESLSSKRLLQGACLLLGLSELGIFWADSFQLILYLRLLQGLLIPAIITSLMTYISEVCDRSRIQRVMSYYIAATILGGFLGRAIAGLVSSVYGWRYAFLLLALNLFVAFWLLSRLPSDASVSFVKLRWANVVGILRQTLFLRFYLVIFCSFFVFASVLNFLPYYVLQIDSGLSEFRIAMMYSGYLMGIVIALATIRLVGMLKSEVNAVVAGLVLYAISVVLLASTDLRIIFVAMFVFCSGMFLIHSVASGYLNRLSLQQKGVVNGLYIAFYYAGGIVGSYLPGFVFRAYGWEAFLGVQFAVLVVALWVAFGIGRLPQASID